MGRKRCKTQHPMAWTTPRSLSRPSEQIGTTTVEFSDSMELIDQALPRWRNRVEAQEDGTWGTER